MSLNIVYIDDEEGLCEAFVDNFATNDILIRTFVDPEKGLQEITNHPPDLVFLDYRLPNTTGDVVAQKISREIPIAVISGDLNAKPHERFLKFFSKPFDFAEIEAFIQSYVDRKKVA